MHLLPQSALVLPSLCVSFPLLPSAGFKLLGKAGGLWPHTSALEHQHSLLPGESREWPFVSNSGFLITRFPCFRFPHLSHLHCQILWGHFQLDAALPVQEQHHFCSSLGGGPAPKGSSFPPGHWGRLRLSYSTSGEPPIPQPQALAGQGSCSSLPAGPGTLPAQGKGEER